MAVVRGVTGWAALTGTAPTGPFTVDTGSDRAFIVALMSEYEGGITVADLFAGGVPFNSVYRSYLDKTGSSQDTVIHYMLWDEASIAAFANGNFTGFDFTAPDPTPLHTNHQFTFCTFTGVRQTTPATYSSASSSSADAVDVTTDSTADDYIIAAFARASSSRDVTDWDSLVEVFDAGGTNFRQGLADGAGGDGTTTVTGDGTADDFHVGALVLHAEPDVTPAAFITQIGDFGIVYDTEVDIEILGNAFEAAQGAGAVALHNYDPADPDQSGDDEPQTVSAWSDTSITFTVDKGALTDDSLFLSVTTNGAEVAVYPIVVRADPGAGEVALRIAGPEESFTVDDPVSIDTSGFFFASDAQDRLAYSSSTLVSGLSIIGKRVTGTIASGAASGSPHSTTIRLTDGDGNFVDEVFTHTVTLPVDPGKPGGTPIPSSLGPRKLRSSAGATGTRLTSRS